MESEILTDQICQECPSKGVKPNPDFTFASIFKNFMIGLMGKLKNTCDSYYSNYQTQDHQHHQFCLLVSGLDVFLC